MDYVKLNFSPVKSDGEKHPSDLEATVSNEKPKCFIGKCQNAEWFQGPGYKGIACTKAEGLSVFALESCPEGYWWKPNEGKKTGKGNHQICELTSRGLCAEKAGE